MNVRLGRGCKAVYIAQPPTTGTHFFIIHPLSLLSSSSFESSSCQILTNPLVVRISKSTKTQPSLSGSLLSCNSLLRFYRLNNHNQPVFIMFTDDEAIATGQLVVYPLVLIAIIFVLARHGLSRQAGFFLLASFCIVRIIGCGFEIASVKKPSQSNITTATILQSLGLSPLLMCSSALLKRM